MNADRLIKPGKAAELLEISYDSLYAGAAGTEKLTRYRVGRQTRYSLHEVEALRQKFWNGRRRQPFVERPCPSELV